MITSAEVVKLVDALDSKSSGGNSIPVRSRASAFPPSLFVADSLIRGVLRAFNRILNWVTNLIPIPGLSSITGIITSILYVSTAYIDETIFSCNLARGDNNPWRSSRDGLVYYAQNAKPILKTAIWSVVLDKVLTVVIWAMMLIPAGFIVYLIPFEGLSIVTLIIAFTMAIN